MTRGMEIALAQRRDCVGIFLGYDAERERASGFGSCFLTVSGAQLRLVTAAHVISGALEEHPICLVRFGAKAFLLQQTPFALDYRSDVAISAGPLCEEIERFARDHIGISRIPDLSEANVNSTFTQDLKLAGLIGFPASKNKFHPKQSNGGGPRLQEILTEQIPLPVGVSPGMLAYHFVRRKLQAPVPDGMSGGPAFRFVAQQGLDKWKALLTGVLVAHMEGQALLASPLSDIRCS